jgi:hypothetical protein
VTKHVDGDRKYHIFSAVYTVVSTDCYGGVVRYASSQSGVMNARGRNVVKFTPHDNSLYGFPGSFVEHEVSSVTRGLRLVIVAFFRWRRIRPHQVVKFWMGSTYECQCMRYYRMFKDTKSLNHHRRKFKEDGCERLRLVVMK